MLKDLLMIRADRAKYYYGAEVSWLFIDSNPPKGES